MPRDLMMKLITTFGIMVGMMTSLHAMESVYCVLSQKMHMWNRKFIIYGNCEKHLVRLAQPEDDL